MTSRWLLVVVTAVGLGAVIGCRAPMPDDQLATGEESLSFFGSGRARLDFGRLTTIRFGRASWQLSEAEAAGLGDVLHVVAGGGRVFLVGVGDDDVPSEHSRQQALARALAVRRGLIERGADPARILVTGLSDEEADGLIGSEDTGPRVQCAVVR